MARAIYIRTPETIERNRRASLALWQRPDYRERIRAVKRKQKPSEQTKERIRQYALNRPAETAQRIADANRRRIYSPATRAKMSEARRRTWADPAFRQRWSESRKRLRKRNTDIEQILMREFKKRRLKFEAQYPYRGFLVDFAFPSVRLMVQADGDYWHRIHKDNALKDRRFDKLVHDNGWTVWRFAEAEIKMHPAACGRAVASFIRAHGG